MSSILPMQKPYDRRHTKENRKTLDTNIRGVLMGGSQAQISLPHVDPS